MSITTKNRFERGFAWAIGAVMQERPEALRLYLDSLPLELESFMRGYLLGYFPFPDADGAIRWRSPEKRGVLLVEDFTIPKKLRASLRKQKYKIRIDYDPGAVIRACAEPTERRPATWLTPELMRVYDELIEMGVLHSIEAWKDGELVGGEFGIAIGGYFSSESAFSKRRDASKATLVYLQHSLADAGFEMIDLQYVSDYMKPFGARMLSRDEFRSRHLRGIIKPCVFGRTSPGARKTLPPIDFG